MTDIFADDLFEIYGTNIQISNIKDYRLGQIEFIQRPVYFEMENSKWGGIGKWIADDIIQFGKMEYYAAIIGETKYKTAIEDAHTRNIYEALIKTAAVGIAEAFSRKGKNVRYRIMNPAWRVSVRSLQEIPALLYRKDGKLSEVYANDELYDLLGEPIAPSIVMVPALYITSTDGNYVFFGNGIQVDNITVEYERLKQAIKSCKEIEAQKKKSNKLFQNVMGGKLQNPKVDIPFLRQTKKKGLAEDNSCSELSEKRLLDPTKEE